MQRSFFNTPEYNEYKKYIENEINLTIDKTIERLEKIHKDDINIIKNPTLKNNIALGDILIKFKKIKQKFVIFFLNPLRYSQFHTGKNKSILSKDISNDNNIKYIFLPFFKFTNDIFNNLPSEVCYTRKQLIKYATKNLKLRPVEIIDNKIKNFIDKNKDSTYDKHFSKCFKIIDISLKNKIVAVVTLKRPKFSNLKGMPFIKKESWTIVNIIKQQDALIYGYIKWIIKRIYELLIKKRDRSKLFSIYHTYKFGKNIISNDEIKIVGFNPIIIYECLEAKEYLQNLLGEEIYKYSDLYKLNFPGFQIVNYRKKEK